MTDQALWIYLRAPFAAYRFLQAGVYRASSPTIPPSAAWGLLLNCAAIETRGSVDELTTPIRDDAPRLRVAVGLVRAAGVATLYQQLHTYPVSKELGKDLKASTHGAKHWIAPGRREVLVDLQAVIGARGTTEILDQIRAGISGTLGAPRYGLPFAGDNNFLFDRLEVVDLAPAVHWYTPVVGDGPPREDTTRVTVAIDRRDASRTQTALVAPAPNATSRPPDEAWFWVPRTP